MATFDIRRDYSRDSGESDSPAAKSTSSFDLARPKCRVFFVCVPARPRRSNLQWTILQRGAQSTLGLSRIRSLASIGSNIMETQVRSAFPLSHASLAATAAALREALPGRINQSPPWRLGSVTRPTHLSLSLSSPTSLCPIPPSPCQPVGFLIQANPFSPL